MRMKDSCDVGIRNKLRQFTSKRSRDFAASSAQLRRNGLHTKRLVDRLFRRGSHDFPAAAQTLIVEDHVSLGRERAKVADMCVRARSKQESNAVVRGIRQMRG
jgi:hypothetical protein